MIVDRSVHPTGLVGQINARFTAFQMTQTALLFMCTLYVTSVAMATYSKKLKCSQF